MSETISLGETIKRIISAKMVDIHTALPGRVKSYDNTKQVADIELMIKRQVPTGGDEDPDILETLPILPSVPVMFPSGGGGYFISFPLQAGDSVLVIFNERDTSHYRSTGDVSDPGLPTTHGLSGAVCFPVTFGPSSNSLSDTSSSDMIIGKDGGSANMTIKSSKVEIGGTGDSAALASKVDKIYTAITTAVAAGSPGTSATAYQANMNLLLNPPGLPPWGSSASDLLKLDS